MRTEHRRALTYVALVIALSAGAAMAIGREGVSDPQLHEIVEALATATALFVGVLALVRFYSKKNNVFLFLGTGFLATTVLDGYHAVVSRDLWSWLASRTLLGVFLCLNWHGWRRERARGQAGRIGERAVYLTTGILTAGTIIVLQVWPTPPLHNPDAVVPISLAIVPATLFALAAMGYLFKAHWKDNAFDHWLVVSLILGMAADGFFMAFSRQFYDGAFDGAHAVKLASYMSVAVGLLISVYRAFRQAEQSTDALVREIVHRERGEEELRKAKETAEAATHAKSEFLARMSHELRTPLNSIIGFANILRKNKRGQLDDTDLEFLERVRDSGLHLLSLINEVLDLSKVEAGKMEVYRQPVSVDALVRETVEQFRGQTVERDLVLQARIPPGLAPLVTDPGKLKQVLINLIGNAIKFTPRGIITVAVEADPATWRPRRVDVIDTGIGIPPDRRNVIFEAFHQAESGTDRSYGGTGLGLTISRSLCRLLGFGLTVTGGPSEGTTFSILFDDGDSPGPDLAPTSAGRNMIESIDSTTS
jgi:signal transduction histidine kinase